MKLDLNRWLYFDHKERRELINDCPTFRFSHLALEMLWISADADLNLLFSPSPRERDVSTDIRANVIIVQKRIIELFASEGETLELESKCGVRLKASCCNGCNGGSGIDKGVRHYYFVCYMFAGLGPDFMIHHIYEDQRHTQSPVYKSTCALIAQVNETNTA